VRTQNAPVDSLGSLRALRGQRPVALWLLAIRRFSDYTRHMLPALRGCIISLTAVSQFRRIAAPASLFDTHPNTRLSKLRAGGPVELHEIKHARHRGNLEYRLPCHSIAHISHPPILSTAAWATAGPTTTALQPVPTAIPMPVWVQRHRSTPRRDQYELHGHGSVASGDRSQR
jgi:hypothetical protein